MNLPSDLKKLLEKSQAGLQIQTLGGFRVWRGEVELTANDWKREKALHLFQYFVTIRRQTAYLHKERIIDELWSEADFEEGDRDFKVALHTINKVLEPERKPRAEPRFVQRYDLTYGLNQEAIWLDVDAFEAVIEAGNKYLAPDPLVAMNCYRQALDLYKGDYLPERRYEDWSSTERERLQVLALNLMTTLANLLVERNPLESIYLTQRVLTIDPIWEDAYRTQMQAYLTQGNRPMAVRTYQQCVKILEEELGLEPLPQTQELYTEIVGR
jgi:two-component SAPR family response regulator